MEVGPAEAFEFDDRDGVGTRVPEVLSDLVEPAKVTTLERLGEGERAIQIATSWLRVKTAPVGK